MANFYGTARSNYFKVKDADAFKKWAEGIPGLGVWEEDGQYGVYADDGDSGMWPSCTYDEETGDHKDLDLVADLAGHLQEGQVAVLMEAGAEKLRYVAGIALAFDHTGSIAQVSLHDIYRLAREKFGIEPTLAEY